MGERIMGRRIGAVMSMLLSASVVLATGESPSQPERARSPSDAVQPKEAWAPLAFLVGDWEAVGSGDPGESKGEFSFRPDLQRRILIRRNESRSPSGVHQDLMLIYPAAGGDLRAFYVDNEGHAIDYRVTATDSSPAAVFTSDGGAGGPRFRLSYGRKADGAVTVVFDVAPPGGEFRTYVSGVARHKEFRGQSS